MRCALLQESVGEMLGLIASYVAGEISRDEFVAGVQGVLERVPFTVVRVPDAGAYCDAFGLECVDAEEVSRSWRGMLLKAYLDEYAGGYDPVHASRASEALGEIRVWDYGARLACLAMSGCVGVGLLLSSHSDADSAGAVVFIGVDASFTEFERAVAEMTAYEEAMRRLAFEDEEYARCYVSPARECIEYMGEAG